MQKATSLSLLRSYKPINDDDLFDNFPIGTTIPELKSLNVKVQRCHDLLQMFHPELNNIGKVFYEALKVGIDWKMFHEIFKDKLVTKVLKQH